MKIASVTFIILLACLALQAAPQDKGFLVKDATLLELETHHRYLSQIKGTGHAPLNARLFAVTGHRITPGKYAIVAYRQFSEDLPSLTDTASFEKVTILLESGFRGSAGEMKIGVGTHAVVFVSFGSSSFPGRSGCFGYGSEGSIHYETKDSNILAHVVFTAQLYGTTRLDKDCKTYDFNKTLLLQKREVSNLTGWDGHLSEHLYEETFPSFRK